jgi:hypothetical protein
MQDAKSLPLTHILAPVIVFCYRRPNHLRRTLLSLLDCSGIDQSPIIVYGDGPRTDKEAASVDQTRALAIELLGDRAEYHFSNVNQGLAASVISGVSDVVSRYGRAIVVEDDLELAPDFLAYMNQALEHFSDDVSIYQVSAYMFNVPELGTSSDALFLQFTVSWGWATWKRAWDQFDAASSGWESLNTDRLMRRKFNLGGAYDYATMLEKQMAGKLDSWAIRWYWTVFKAGGLVLFPPSTLVRNNGFDGSGSHGRGLLRRYNHPTYMPLSNCPNMPAIDKPDPSQVRLVYNSLRRLNGGFLAKLIDILRRWSLKARLALSS